MKKKTAEKLEYSCCKNFHFSRKIKNLQGEKVEKVDMKMD